jgi:hypothetical protein
MFLDYFLVFFFQVLFNILKVYEIRFSYENNTRKLVINSIMMNLMTILSFYYSLNLMISGDWKVIIVFVSGGALGKLIATTNFQSHRSEIWKFMNNKLKK